MFYIIIALLLVLLVVWIGINAAYIRKHDTPASQKEQREPSGRVSEPSRRVEVEVDVEETSAEYRAGVFRGRAPSYVLHAVNVPLFTEGNWQMAFQRLTDDRRVLGWTAFHEDRFGAADRAYEQEFIDTLRQHHRATERLRRQAGLSRVSETAVVGDEGKVWFLTVLDDAWFALFIDRDEDGMELAAELLAPVRLDNPDKTLPTKA